MPIYEYTCKECLREFSRLRKVGADSDGVSCPDCHSTEVERKVSAFSGGASSGVGSGVSGAGPSCTGFT